METLTIRAIVTFECELGFTKIILEGVSLTITRELTGGEYTILSISHLLEIVKHEMNWTRTITMVHTKMTENIIAHQLTRHVKYIDSEDVWLEQAPYFIYIVALDRDKAQSNADSLLLMIVLNST